MFSSLFDKKTSKAKDPSEYGIEIPLEIKALIEKFDPKIRIKIKDTPKIYAQAPVLNPTCIILSKPLFERKTNNVEEFTIEDITVIVAHELGHIIPKSHFTFSFLLIAIGATVLFVVSFLELVLYTWIPTNCFTLS